ncbi:MAG: hypothetical protein R3E52_01830 [Burkholderiaceae bacterium]
MGSYQLVLRGGSDIGVSLSTLEGGLRLSGNGHWVGTRLLRKGEGKRRARPAGATGQPPLNILGRREGDRAIILSFS